METKPKRYITPDYHELIIFSFIIFIVSHGFLDVVFAVYPYVCSAQIDYQIGEFCEGEKHSNPSNVNESCHIHFHGTYYVAV